MRLRTKVFLSFLATVVILVGSLLIFIQSRYFATILKKTVAHYLPFDIGVVGDFSDLSVKLIPPGVVIKSPSLNLKEKNIAGLPAGTRLDAQFIDVTFQFFQLLTGAVTINAFSIHGATLKVDLDEEFFAKHARSLNKRENSIIVPKLPTKFSWDSLVHFNFRSVSLVDSQIDIRTKQPTPIHVQALAKELTIGRSTVNSLPVYDLAIDFQKSFIESTILSHSLSQFQASVEISSQGVSVRNLGLQDGELNFHTNGHIRGNILEPKSLKADLAYILRGPITDWLGADFLGRFLKLPKNMPLAGNLILEGKFLGDLMSIEKTAETKATLQLEKALLGEWRADEAEIKFHWKAPLLKIEGGKLRIEKGTIHIHKFALDTSDKNQEISAHVDLDEVDFRKVVGPALKSVYPLHMIVGGGLDLNVSIGKEFAIEGAANLKVSDFSFDNQKPGITKPLKVVLAIKELALKSKFYLDEEGFSFEQTELTLPNSHVKAFGEVDSKNGFNIDVNGHVHLEDIGKLAAFDIGGDGQLHWTVKGKLPEVIFSFEAELKDARYLNLNLGNAKGRIVYNDRTEIINFYNLQAQQGRSEFLANGSIAIDDSDLANMTVQVSHGTIQDFISVFLNFIKKSVPWYPYDLTGQISGLIKVSGQTPLDKLSVEGDMELQNIEYKHEIFRYGRVHGGYRRGAYVAENINVRKKNGWLKGNLLFGTDDVMRFDLHSENLTTLDLDHLGSLGILYRAPIVFETKGLGKLGNLKSEFKLVFGDGVIRTFSVPGSELNFKTDNARLNGSLSVFAGSLKGNLDWGWEKGSESNFQIKAKRFDFTPILIAINNSLGEDPELFGDVNGEARLKFQTGAISKLSGDLNFESFLLRKHGYSLSLSKPTLISIRNGNYEFSDLKLLGEGTSVAASGKVSDGVIRYDIDGNFSLGLFEFLVPEIASVRGSSQVKAQLTGAADSPNLHAQFIGNGTDLRIKSIEQPFEELKFKAEWNNDLISVSDILTKFAGGTVQGSGTARLFFNKAPTLDFKMDLDNPKVKVYPVTYARSSGRLSLIGDDLPYKIKGNLRVAEALIKENFSLSEGSRMLRSSKFLPQKKAGGSGDLQLFELDIDILADRNIFLKNDLFDAEVKGNIKIINNFQTPRLLGNISVLHGRLLFKDNFFTVQNGDVRFNNPTALDPEFNLTGQTEVKGYKIGLLASGSVSDYKLNFTSQPPLSQSDIVSLLTIGVTSSEYQNISRESRDAYSRDEMYGLIFSQSGVNKSLQEKLGVKVRVDQSQTLVPENVFRARSTADTPAAVSPKVVLQKEVTKNLNASFGSTVGVGENTERNVGLEYGFSRNWSLRGIYEDQSGPQLKQSRTSVGADLKFKLKFK